MRVLWTAKRSNQSILKEISPEYSLEGLMLNLKLQYFGHLMWRTDSFEKTLMLGKIEGGGDWGWDGSMASLTQSSWVWVNSGSWWWTGRPGVLQSMGSQRVRHYWVTELNISSVLPCYNDFHSEIGLSGLNFAYLLFYNLFLLPIPLSSCYPYDIGPTLFPGFNSLYTHMCR